MGCIFCKIVSGEMPSHQVWEDDKHLAFLSIFPNTAGTTVVITKDHHPSYLFDLPEDVSRPLVKAARIVAKKIDKAFDDVGRTGMVFEGFGVDHVHAKLFPLHGTMSDNWQQHSSKIDTYFENYPGYISSHDSERADDEDLSKIAQQIKNA
jgi:histidine triad (HIT) family protein